jgi:hypothetical protein
VNNKVPSDECSVDKVLRLNNGLFFPVLEGFAETLIGKTKQM